MAFRNVGPVPIDLLVIKTAKALSLTIAPTVLARADAEHVSLGRAAMCDNDRIVRAAACGSNSGLTRSLVPVRTKVIAFIEPSAFSVSRVVTISSGTVTGHASAGGAILTDVEFLNREAGAFLKGVTDNGEKLN